MNLEELLSIIGSFTILLVPALVGSLFGAYLTYRFAIKQYLLQRRYSEKIDLYRPLFDFIISLIDADQDTDWSQLENQANKVLNQLLLFAPDRIINDFLSIMTKVRKGASVRPLINYLLEIRNDLIPETKITPEDIIRIEFRR